MCSRYFATFDPTLSQSSQCHQIASQSFLRRYLMGQVPNPHINQTIAVRPVPNLNVSTKKKSSQIIIHTQHIFSAPPQIDANQYKNLFNIISTKLSETSSQNSTVSEHTSHDELQNTDLAAAKVLGEYCNQSTCSDAMSLSLTALEWAFTQDRPQANTYNIIPGSPNLTWDEYFKDIEMSPEESVEVAGDIPTVDDLDTFLRENGVYSPNAAVGEWLNDPSFADSATDDDEDILPFSQVPENDGNTLAETSVVEVKSPQSPVLVEELTPSSQASQVSEEEEEVISQASQVSMGEDRDITMSPPNLSEEEEEEEVMSQASQVSEEEEEEEEVMSQASQVSEEEEEEEVMSQASQVSEEEEEVMSQASQVSMGEDRDITMSPPLLSLTIREMLWAEQELYAMVERNRLAAIERRGLKRAERNRQLAIEIRGRKRAERNRQKAIEIRGRKRAERNRQEALEKLRRKREQRRQTTGN